MKHMLLRIFASLTLALATATSASSQDVCGMLDGAVIVAQDSEHTYLGRISSQYDSESIFNEYGNYGSKYSSQSIWNEYSTFGSKYSNYSPFNQYTSEPPMVIKDQQLVAYLTTNKYLRGALSPYLLKASCQ